MSRAVLSYYSKHYVQLQMKCFAQIVHLVIFFFVVYLLGSVHTRYEKILFKQSSYDFCSIVATVSELFFVLSFLLHDTVFVISHIVNVVQSLVTIYVQVIPLIKKSL